MTGLPHKCAASPRVKVKRWAARRAHRQSGEGRYVYYACSPVAEHIRRNTLPKHVASSTLTEPKRFSSTVIGGEVVGLAELKRQVSREILIRDSYQLVHTLIGHDLVDESRLVVFP